MLTAPFVATAPVVAVLMFNSEPLVSPVPVEATDTALAVVIEFAVTDRADALEL